MSPEVLLQLDLSPDAGTIGDIVLPEKAIADRVAELGWQITCDYRDRDLLAVAILKGALVFGCDLVRRIDGPLEFDMMGISRYKKTPIFKEVTITHDLRTDVRGKDLLIVEDIVDTGLTLNYLIQVLEERKPRSVAVCSLLDRPGLRLAEIPLRYVGFNVSEEFLVGYGLDFCDRYRGLPYIASMQF